MPPTCVEELEPAELEMLVEAMDEEEGALLLTSVSLTPGV